MSHGIPVHDGMSQNIPVYTPGYYTIFKLGGEHSNFLTSEISDVVCLSEVALPIPRAWIL